MLMASDRLTVCLTYLLTKWFIVQKYQRNIYESIKNIDLMKEIFAAERGDLSMLCLTFFSSFEKERIDSFFTLVLMGCFLPLYLMTERGGKGLNLPIPPIFICKKNWKMNKNRCSGRPPVTLYTMYNLTKQYRYYTFIY